jgi:hypothetical protein
LITVIVFFILLHVSHAQNTDKNSIGTENKSSNLREVYYGTILDQEPALIGKVGIALVEPTGIRQVPIDYAFKSGDKFRFIISSNHNGYLYIIHRSLKNELTQLWPRTNMSDAFEIGSGQTYTVPPSPGSFVFDEEVGKEQFYIAVRSEPKVPNLNVLGKSGRADQTVGALNVNKKPVTQEVEWVIRGDPFGEGSTRGVVFDPGTKDGDLYRYFSAIPGDRSNKAMVQVILNHRNKK